MLGQAAWHSVTPCLAVYAPTPSASDRSQEEEFFTREVTASLAGYSRFLADVGAILQSGERVPGERRRLLRYLCMEPRGEHSQPHCLRPRCFHSHVPPCAMAASGGMGLHA